MEKQERKINRNNIKKRNLKNLEDVENEHFDVLVFFFGGGAGKNGGGSACILLVLQYSKVFLMIFFLDKGS